MAHDDLHAQLNQMADDGEFNFSVETRMDRMAKSGELGFALDSPKAVLHRSQNGSVQPFEAPEQDIRQRRETVDGDPNLAEGIDTLVDYLVGTGGSVQPRNVPFTDAQLTQQDIADMKQLIETSKFEMKLWNWVWHALVDGMAFLEINWTDQEVFKPRLLPAERMSLIRNEYGEIIGYEMESQGESDNIEFGKYDVAHLGFWRHPADDWYMSIVDRVKEQTDMLRDMEIDMARFVATKAYPPILWKLGDENNEWNNAEINAWLDEVSQIEPDSMLAAPHDVDWEAVGANTGQGGGSADLGLDSTFEHLQTRMATGLGLPYFLLNGDMDGSNDAIANMPKFDRRIQRLRTVIRTSIEDQIFHSIQFHDNPEEHEGELVPRYEFGEHSSEEERLEVDKALKLFNNGFLTREALAQRVGIDPEQELPSMDKLQNEIAPLIQQLSGKGDDIQNPSGGSPTDTGGGAESSGGEVKSRQNPERSVDDDSRNQQSIDQE